MEKKDIEDCIDDLRDIFPLIFDRLPDHVQDVLIELRFKLGPMGFWKLDKLKAAIWNNDFDAAADEISDNKLANIMQNGYDN
jgi:hypothetical protein